MPAVTNPADSYERVAERADQTDPFVMYYAVRKDLPLSLERAMSLGGAGAVLCSRWFRSDPDHSKAFDEWYESSFRKVALRCKPTQLERIITEEDAAVIRDESDDAPILACMPPRRRSESPALIRKLQAYTDAPVAAQPTPDPDDDRPLMVYVIRAEVMKSAGKAIAQAGHAALMVDYMLGSDYKTELGSWIETGAHGRLLIASDEQWQALKRDYDCVVVRDAGLTQVEAGTETVIALPPVPGIADELGLILQSP